MRFASAALALLVLAALARPAARADSAPSIRPRLVARYVGDEPHAEASRDGDAWVERVIGLAVDGDPLRSTTQADGARDLLAHTGPGPAGSEWNSDADLLLLIDGVATVPTPTVALSLERSSLPSRLRCGPARCVASAVIASARWRGALRPLRAADARRLALPVSPSLGLAILWVRARGRWSGRRFSVEAALLHAEGE